MKKKKVFGGHEVGTVVNGKILKKDGNWYDYKKKSGATSGKDKKHGKYYVSAWNVSKQSGLVKITAFENDKSEIYDRDDSSKAISMLFEIRYTRFGTKQLEIGFYNLNTGVVVLGDWGWTIATKAPNGGFMGRYKKK